MNKPHPATLLLVIPFVVAMLPAMAHPAQTTGAARLVRSPGGAQSFKPVEWLVGRAVDGSDANATPGSRIDILIERWSTDDEYKNLRTALREGRADNALAALRKGRRRVGVVQFPGRQGLGARARTRRGQNLLFAREIKTAAGRQVIVATDGYPGFGEPARDARRPEQGFALIDIRLASNGDGIGKMAIAPRLTHNVKTDSIELEDYDAQPVRLTSVRSTRP